MFKKKTPLSTPTQLDPIKNFTSERVKTPKRSKREGRFGDYLESTQIADAFKLIIQELLSERPEGKDVFHFMAQRLREIGQGRSDERLGEIGEKILPKALVDVKKYKNSPFSAPLSVEEEHKRQVQEVDKLRMETTVKPTGKPATIAANTGKARGKTKGETPEPQAPAEVKKINKKVSKAVVEAPPVAGTEDIKKGKKK